MATKGGRFEIRESRNTPDGPRSRTLVSFRELTEETIEKARGRAKNPGPSAEELRAAALRAGAPVAPPPAARAARELLTALAKGKKLDPMLKRLLLDALLNEDRSDRPTDPSASVSDAARSVSEWIGTSAEERGDTLRELLLLADALPPPRPESEPPLPGKTVAVHERLGMAKVPHAIGGALAVAYYAEPRSTVDIDVNVFVATDRWPRVRDALAPLGIDVEIDLAALERDGRADLFWGDNPVDLFFSQDDLHEAMRRATRRAPFGEVTLPIVSPEHLVVRKAILDRAKDWLDIEQILVATDPIDLAEIEHWLERMVGPSDPRVRHLEEIKAALSLNR